MAAAADAADHVSQRRVLALFRYLLIVASTGCLGCCAGASWLVWLAISKLWHPWDSPWLPSRDFESNSLCHGMNYCLVSLCRVV